MLFYFPLDIIQLIKQYKANIYLSIALDIPYGEMTIEQYFHIDCEKYIWWLYKHKNYINIKIDGYIFELNLQQHIQYLSYGKLTYYTSSEIETETHYIKHIEQGFEHKYIYLKSNIYYVDRIIMDLNAPGLIGLIKTGSEIKLSHELFFLYKLRESYTSYESLMYHSIDSNIFENEYPKPRDEKLYSMYDEQKKYFNEDTAYDFYWGKILKNTHIG
jgi:hypothetical protein